MWHYSSLKGNSLNGINSYYTEQFTQVNIKGETILCWAMVWVWGFTTNDSCFTDFIPSLRCYWGRAWTIQKVTRALRVGMSRLRRALFLFPVYHDRVVFGTCSFCHDALLLRAQDQWNQGLWTEFSEMMLGQKVSFLPQVVAAVTYLVTSMKSLINVLPKYFWYKHSSCVMESV